MSDGADLSVHIVLPERCAGMGIRLRIALLPLLLGLSACLDTTGLAITRPAVTDEDPAAPDAEAPMNALSTEAFDETLTTEAEVDDDKIDISPIFGVEDDEIVIEVLPVEIDISVTYFEATLVPPGSELMVVATDATGQTIAERVIKTEAAQPFGMTLPLSPDASFPVRLNVRLTSTLGGVLGGQISLPSLPTGVTEIAVGSN